MTDYELAKSQKPYGIAGWLILPTLGMFYTLIAIARDIAQALTEVARNQNQDVSGVELLLVANILLFTAWVVTTVFLFQHKRAFPKLYIGLVAATLILNFGTVFLAVQYFGQSLEPDDIKATVQPVMSLVIWGPYMLVSKRVKNTFTK